MVSTKEIFTMYGVPNVGIVEHNGNLFRFCVEDLELICMFVNSGFIYLGFMTQGSDFLVYSVGEDPCRAWNTVRDEDFIWDIWEALKRGELSMFTQEECAITYIYNGDFIPVLT